MATFANITAKLLRDASTFFRNVGEQNHSVKTQMDDNAEVFEEIAALIEEEPGGFLAESTDESPGESGEVPRVLYSEAGAKLLLDAAAFFRKLGDQNENLKEEFYENASVYEQIAHHVKLDPEGELVLEGE